MYDLLTARAERIPGDDSNVRLFILEHYPTKVDLYQVRDIVEAPNIRTAIRLSRINPSEVMVDFHGVKKSRKSVDGLANLLQKRYFRDG